MRLLNAKTLKLEKFSSGKIPPYVILSHTWEMPEIEMGDMENAEVKQMKGWGKIQATCDQAIRDGHQYVWIDTCCIDKTNTEELRKALRSMFSWYMNAVVCYVYLSDVPGNCDVNRKGSEFENSRWFTRGWTLQELLAPAKVTFFSQDWVEIGTKHKLATTLSRITWIDKEVLMKSKRLESTSVAKRMSWAARRETTQPEDMAYCLMGIFSAYIYTDYGEGGKEAFIRLQKKIIECCDDRSIFAWCDSKDSSDTSHDLLATSPAQFASSRNIVPYDPWERRTDFLMTNRGICIDLPLVAVDKVADTYIASLDCFVEPEGDPHLGYVSIIIKRVSSVNCQYVRTRINNVRYVDVRGASKLIYIGNDAASLHSQRRFPMPTFEILPCSMIKRDAVLLVRRGINVEVSKPLFREEYSVPENGSQTLDVCIASRTSSRATIVVMLAMKNANVLTFDALETTDRHSWGVNDIPYLSERFQPHDLGTWVKLAHRRVKVMAKIDLKSGRRWCSVTNISIERV
ncbi:heterokaryon incompatibility protein-domain-containing protein [Aspergillus bertholletiae]|uniref:Heterokaryon incompatibility protein-domain-containing protein n=1 Tax=Aspergillus bertholletiae TaxID=1226010 RepID=A0A5N7AY92_9EURO|nr:heterokaryon incompatibility protein-domain-containing protein [Aspergillus bertholletiae]